MIGIYCLEMFIYNHLWSTACTLNLRQNDGIFHRRDREHTVKGGIRSLKYLADLTV